MFTGIITDIGHVRSVRDTNRDRRFEIETRYDPAGVDIGASIAHAGCCLTVVDKGDDWFAVEVSGESLAMTTIDAWREGRRVNLERPARGSISKSICWRDISRAGGRRNRCSTTARSPR